MKTFVLGVGAQKAGTSWLWKYISQHKNANMGFVKEYHIWDGVHLDLFPWYRLPLDQAANMNTFNFFRAHMQNIDGFYEGYFNSIFNSGYSITGDITPEYSGLTVEQLLSVKAKIESIGARLKVVFLMRDPIERCWSFVRMEKTRNKNLTKPDGDYVRQMHSTPRFQLLTRYENTCRNLRAAFDEHELYFGIYENLFEREQVQRLSDFLEIEPQFGLAKERVNTSDKKEEIPGELVSMIREFYADTYAFCGEKFPETKRLWALENGG